MSLKRIHPSYSYLELPDETLENTLDDDLSEYECFRKLVKKDPSSFAYPYQQEDPNDEEFPLEIDQHYETGNLYAQEFQNLRACSFKTISRIGQDKNYTLIKNQVAQSDEKFPISNKKRRMSFINLSEEKSKQNETVSQNMVRNLRKPLASFGSLNQISKLEKRSSLDGYRLNALKRLESSVSGLAPGSMNSINTQMMNEMIDFTINDENEVDEAYLEKMVETAVIGNVKFAANLRIVREEPKNEDKFYQNLTIFKIVEVDGFSIKSFYAPEDKIRINLNKPITNKEFKKRCCSQLTSLSNNQTQNFQQKCFNGEVQFSGSLYDFKNQQTQEIKFYLSKINQNLNEKLNENEIENINLDNRMDSFECSLGFGVFGMSKAEIN